MKYYLEDYEAVLTEKKSNPNGISESDAKARIDEFGQNKLVE